MDRHASAYCLGPPPGTPSWSVFSSSTIFLCHRCYQLFTDSLCAVESAVDFGTKYSDQYLIINHVRSRRGSPELCSLAELLWDREEAGKKTLKSCCHAEATLSCKRIFSFCGRNRLWTRWTSTTSTTATTSWHFLCGNSLTHYRTECLSTNKCDECLSAR